MKKPFLLAACSFGAFLLLSSLASAQVTGAGVQTGMGTFADIINTFNRTVVKALGTLFMSGAVVAFLFGLAKFVWGLREGDPKVLTNGKQFMIWSLVALFVMFSVYGIIKFFQGFVPGLGQTTITIPEVNYGTGGTGNNVGNQQQTFTCPDGVTKYYDQSDYNTVCSNSNNNQNNNQNSQKANGEQCTLPSNCLSGNCQAGPYGSQCAPPVGAKANGAQCTLPSECASGNCQAGQYGSQCAPASGNGVTCPPDEFGNPQEPPC